MTVLLVIAILVFLIVVHELGHFVAAKLFRIRVDEFGIGYPPRALSFGKWGETEYTLNWLPFGGFVKLYGEDGPARGVRSLSGSSKMTQAIVLVAGVAMNALAAWLLFSLALSLGMPRAIYTNDIAGNGIHLIINSIVPGSPADAAGLKAGDEMLAISAPDTKQTAALSPEDVVEFMKSRGGKEVSITYLRAGQTYETQLSPAHGVLQEAAARPATGIGLVLVSEEVLSWGGAFKEGFTYTLRAFKTVAVGLYNLIADALTGRGSLEGVVGPVGLTTVVGDAARHGIGNVLGLAAFISVNLALINLIPVPALDGGRLAIIIAEAIRRRPVPMIALSLLNVSGFAVVILLMIAVTYNDIARLLV